MKSSKPLSTRFHLDNFTRVERLLLAGLIAAIAWGSVGVGRESRWGRGETETRPTDLYRQLRGSLPDEEALLVLSAKSSGSEIVPAPLRAEPPGRVRPSQSRPGKGEKVEVSEDGWVFFPLTCPDRVDINRAGLEELMTLPGVGPVIARRMLDYRRKHGGFGSKKTLLKVKGIGGKKYERLKERITVY